MEGTPVYVIRHAEAGDRERWNGPDRERPLSSGGRHQVADLAQRFADERVVQFLSSPYLRCMQTLEPLAAARGMIVEPRDQLAEGRPWEYLEKLVLEAEAEGPTVVSVHGDSFRALMADLFDRGIARKARQSFRKGAAWVLTVHEGAIVGARHLPAPPAD
jgi:8-oxo-dGTP diphosphatase